MAVYVKEARVLANHSKWMGKMISNLPLTVFTLEKIKNLGLHATRHLLAPYEASQMMIIIFQTVIITRTAVLFFRAVLIQM